MGSSLPVTPSILSPASPGCTPVQELEHLMSTCSAELAGRSDVASSAWSERVGAMSARLENVCLCHGGSESAPLVPAALLLCRQLVRRGAKEPELLEGALTVARTTKMCLAPLALQNLSSAGAVASFRAALQALAELQQLSKCGDAGIQRLASPILLELPPVLARIIDNLEAPAQLVAWVRVAAEVLEEFVGGSGRWLGIALLCALCGPVCCT